jgi:hypothetical protein
MEIEKVWYPVFRAGISNSWGGSFEGTYRLDDELSEEYDVTVLLSGTGGPYERAER